MKKLSIILSGTFGLVLAVWSPSGPSGGPVYSGDISRTSPAVIYFAPYTSSTKLVKSTDEGSTWLYTTGTIPSYVTNLLVHPDNPDVVYALIGSSIYKSISGGSSWTRLSVPTSNYFRQMVFNPVNPDEIYAVGYNYSGSANHTIVARTTDAGANWNVFICDTGSTASYGYSVAVDPVDTAVVYAAGYRGIGATMVYRSTDQGETWQELPLGVNNLYPYAIHISPADPNIIIVAPYSGGIYRSTDRGANWTRTATVYNVLRLACAQGNPGVIYASTTSAIYRSEDTGRTWVNISTGLTGKPYFCLLPSPTATATVYLGTTAGMFASTDYGNNWTHITAEFPFNKVNVIALANDHATLYAECQDNAVYKSSDNGNSWIRCSEFLACGNICGIGVHPDDPLDVWALEGSG
ncbi:MAG: WD40/YVTN/BNR-like repeat-containing protein [bacterium]